MILAATPVIPDRWSQTTSNRSRFFSSQVPLDAPQREQQVDLTVGDRLPLNACEDHLELGSDMLSRIRGKRRRCELPVRTSLVTHLPTCLYADTSGGTIIPAGAGIIAAH